MTTMTTQKSFCYDDDDDKKNDDFVPARNSSSATAVFLKQSSKEYQSIKDARRALNVMSLNAKEDMDSIERQTYEQISKLARDALRKKKKKKEEKTSSSHSFLLSSLVGKGTPPKGEREEREGERAFSLAYLEAREERSPPGQTKMDDTFDDDENTNEDDDDFRKKRSSFDFGFNDDDAERSTNELPKAFKVPMTVPRGAFRRRDEEYYYEEGEDETFASSSSDDEKEFEFNQSMVEETHFSSSVAAEAEENGNVGEREDWWFNVSTPAPAIFAAKEKKTEELTPEQVLDRFDFTENKEAPFNSSAAAKSSISASPLYASPAYSFEKQFEDTLRFLGAMDLRTFKEQLLESTIDAVITEASASTLSNLTNGTPGSRADAWRTRVDEACEMLENAGAEAASEALMAKARALAAAVLKRR
tara:strand:+ start:2129 stop:3382 length:1254 start_codon:yes stop_codon:yes gene_type:complete